MCLLGVQKSNGLHLIVPKLLQLCWPSVCCVFSPGNGLYIGGRLFRSPPNLELFGLKPVLP